MKKASVKDCLPILSLHVSSGDWRQKKTVGTRRETTKEEDISCLTIRSSKWCRNFSPSSLVDCLSISPSLHRQEKRGDVLFVSRGRQEPLLGFWWKFSDVVFSISLSLFDPSLVAFIPSWFLFHSLGFDSRWNRRRFTREKEPKRKLWNILSWFSSSLLSNRQPKERLLFRRFEDFLTK